jgi:hypothetical protein
MARGSLFDGMKYGHPMIRKEKPAGFNETGGLVNLESFSQFGGMNAIRLSPQSCLQSLFFPQGCLPSSDLEA